MPVPSAFQVVALLAGAALLAGCAPRAVPLGVFDAPFRGALTPRPPGTPDVVIFAVSGRCVFPCANAPDDNWDYLTPRGTVNAVATAISDLGLEVRAYAYSSHLLERHRSNLSGRDELGFLQLERDFRQVRDTLVVGRSNPARIVLLAHSHGVNWTHTLARLYPNTPISLAIDLDGICALWEGDNREVFRSFYTQFGGSPWPVDISRACDVTYVSRRAYRVKDIAYPNIARNFEVQSQRVLSSGEPEDPRNLPANVPFDFTRNIRPDGSRAGIETFVSLTEDHSTVTRPASRSLAWVRSRIETLGWRPNDGSL